MQTLEKHDIRDPEISKKIAVKLVEFHRIDMPGPRKAKIWERLRLAFHASILVANVVGSFDVSSLTSLSMFDFIFFQLNYFFLCLSYSVFGARFQQYEFGHTLAT